MEVYGHYKDAAEFLEFLITNLTIATDVSPFRGSIAGLAIQNPARPLDELHKAREATVAAGNPIPSIEEDRSDFWAAWRQGGFQSDFAASMNYQTVREHVCPDQGCPSPYERVYDQNTTILLEIPDDARASGRAVHLESELLADWRQGTLPQPLACNVSGSHPARHD